MCSCSKQDINKINEYLDEILKDLDLFGMNSFVDVVKKEKWDELIMPEKQKTKDDFLNMTKKR